MRQVEVSLGERSYAISIGKGEQAITPLDQFSRPLTQTDFTVEFRRPSVPK